MWRQLGVDHHVLDRSALIDDSLSELVNDVRGRTGFRSADRANVTRLTEPTVSWTDHAWRGDLVVHQQFLDGTRRSRPQTVAQTDRSWPLRSSWLEQVPHFAILVLAFPAFDNSASPIACLHVEVPSPIDSERSR